MAGGSSEEMDRAQLADLRRRLLEISDLNAAASVLSWDEAVFMPPAGAVARGRQRARLAALAHKQAADPDLGRLLDRLSAAAETLPYDSDEASLVRIAKRDFDLAARVPGEYVTRANEHSSASYNAWIAARPANDFAATIPYLEKTLELSREFAGFFPGYGHIMDPLIGPDEGFTAREVSDLFVKLRAALVPLADAIAAQPPSDDSFLYQSFPAAGQIAFATKIATDFGYDLSRGRIDRSPHPFCTAFARDDVRITTRVKENDLSDALFSILHEAGHALYEMGIPPELAGTPLGHGASAGVHESQSRLWENIVGRSLPFWEHYYPRLQATFPSQLGGIPLATFYRAINKVGRTLIRTDADEVTYNLHVMIRFDLEMAMLEGRLAVRDLRDAWNSRYEADLGITPPSDKDGVLQDVHWFGGAIGGAFQGYTIGNILSAQLYETALAARPGIPGEISRGEFAGMRDWLNTYLHSHGRKYDGPELAKRALGAPISIEPYMRYLGSKYGEIYGLM
jgi:carboxypeptidase Taq